MSATSETRVTKRQILLVGPYGVLGNILTKTEHSGSEREEDAGNT